MEKFEITVKRKLFLPVTIFNFKNKPKLKKNRELKITAERKVFLPLLTRPDQYPRLPELLTANQNRRPEIMHKEHNI